MPEKVTLLDSIQVPTMKVSLRSDHLIQIEVDDGAVVNLVQVKEQIAAIGKVGGGKKYPVLILAGKDSSLNTEVMDFVAKEGSNPFALAEGYLINSISHKLLANFYLRINKPARPTRVFTVLENALEWLDGFKEI